MKRLDNQPVFLCDSREQQPYEFTPSERATLSTGDYSVRTATGDYRDRIAIERKSLGDLLGCIGGSRERFERELQRLSHIQYRALVIEATFHDTLEPTFRHLHPNAILGTLVAWSLRYGLPIWFANDRDLAQRLAERLLRKAYEYSEAGGSAID